MSQAILKLSGTVVVVDPIDRYVQALGAVRGAHAGERVLLENFAGHGLAPLAAPHGRIATDRRLAAALRRLRVDLACVRPRERRAQALLRSDRFAVVAASRRTMCMRRPAAAPLP